MRRTLLLALAALAAVCFGASVLFERPAQAVSTSVVISQVYGGAGCGTVGCSTYKNDYIELFNRGTSAVSLNGWSVQYASATGTAWQTTNLTNVTLQPGQYYLVAESSSANGVNNIPTPDATGTIAMSATAAKVALVNTTTALSGACPAGAQIIDLIGYGSTANCSETAVAPAPSTTTADVRAGAGCTDTDNNSADFTATTPNPRNTSSTLNVCSAGGTPTPTPTPLTLSINDVSQDEGNAGTTAFTFTVSLSTTSASNVTFNWSTADGTATAPSDYTAVTNGTGTITAGSTSTTVTVNVNGDTTTEPNETFFVNISNVVGATVTDGQGQGTIVNDDITLTPIYQIQGSGSTSPFVNTSVTTTGIVTGIKSGSSGGFFIQDPNGDGNTATSDGVFVFTGSTLPAGAVVGNSVRVTATVQEFIPSSDPYQHPETELSGTPTVAVISTGNTLPAPVTITAADTQVNDLDNLEKYEGMRVQVSSLTVIAPTQGNINEPNATVTSTGVFYGVVTGVPRPFREPGINVSDPLPAGAPANVPRFDENPERIRVDSDAQPGTTAVNVTAGTVITNVVGELDFAFRTYTILPETTLTPGANISATPVPTPRADEMTVASFNMERFFDTANDPSTSDPVLTTTAFNNRLNKASLVIRNVQRSPDVIGVEEVENLATLQAVADKVNADAGTPNDYVAYLSEGNDVGGIDVGFLVRSSRVNVIDVTQVGKDATYVNPNNNTAELLNDRPPLVLRGTINRPAGGTMAFTVIVNHLRSLSGVDDPVDGNRIRTKRRAQAEFLANYIQTRQTNDPTEKIISVGDYNAFQVNDGYVDVIGTIKGTPAPPDQVVLASSDLVNPDLTDLVDTLPADQRYSFTFDGNAQVLDHIIVNQPALAVTDRFAYARDDADFPLVYYADGTRPERISDHDQPVAYFSLAQPQPAGSLIFSEFRFRGPGGTADEFIELYNNTDGNITVSTTDGSAGWAVAIPAATTVYTIPNGTVIPPRRHYLIANSGGYSLGGYATPDGTYTLDISDGAGLALFQTANPANFTAANRLDAAGYASAGQLFREGSGLDIGGAEINTFPEHSLLRRLESGTPADTGDNVADFIGVSTTGVNVAASTRLGAPGPENLASPVQHNADVKARLIDATTSSSAAPNRVRDATPYVDAFTPSSPSGAAPAPGAGTSYTLGTLAIRRRFVNNTGQAVTRLRFRIVDVTTFGTPNGFGGAQQADLRALTTPASVVVTSNDPSVCPGGIPGCAITVRATTLEQPPSQPQGGGFNSTLSVDLSSAPIPAGQTVDVQFLLGVAQGGKFRFFTNVEAELAPPQNVPAPEGIRKAPAAKASAGPGK